MKKKKPATPEYTGATFGDFLRGLGVFGGIMAAFAGAMILAFLVLCGGIAFIGWMAQV